MKSIKFSIIIFISLNILYPGLLFSQTYLVPTIGRNYSYLEGYRNCSLFDIKEPIDPEEQFKNNTWFAGIGVKQYIANKFILGINFDITQKHIKYKKALLFDHEICDTVHNKNLNYKQLNSSLILSYIPIKNLHLNAGISARYYFDGVLYKEVIDELNPNIYHAQYKIYNSQLHFDWLVGVAYNFKNFLFSFNYRQSFKHRYIWNPDYWFLVRSPYYHKSFDISVSYLFKVFDKRNKRLRVNCPKL